MENISLINAIGDEFKYITNIFIIIFLTRLLRKKIIFIACHETVVVIFALKSYYII